MTFKKVWPVKSIIPVFTNNSGFSIMGTLVASAIGLIVLIGITKSFVQMDSKIKQATQKTQRISLISLLGNHINDPGHCKETLLPSATQISAGTDTNLQQIKVQGGGMALDLVAEKSQLKTKYGMEGLVDFQLKCEEAGGVNACKKCAGPFPCSPVKWSLSLISQTKVNNIPSFNRILQQPLNITHTGPNDSDFECGFLASQPQLACEDQKGTIEGYSHGNKKCYYLCPKGKTRKDGFGCDAGCPSGQVWIGSQCVEYCEGIRERAGQVGYDPPSLMPGIKLNNKCHFPCFNQNTSNNTCIFVPKLSLWLQRTKTMNNERLNHPKHILLRSWFLDYNDYLLFF
ncbi:MAG: hypothetical protein OXJ52_10100 [Oligoflexia bacterium]|nr:hypothetical protein [Oligoflexia bacterium]